MTSKSFAQTFELKLSLDDPLSKLRVTPPFSIKPGERLQVPGSL